MHLQLGMAVVSLFPRTERKRLCVSAAGRANAWLDLAGGSAEAEAKAPRGYAQRGRGGGRQQQHQQQQHQQQQHQEQQPAAPRQADRAPAAPREPKQPSPDAQQPDDEDGFVYPNRVRHWSLCSSP